MEHSQSVMTCQMHKGLITRRESLLEMNCMLLVNMVNNIKSINSISIKNTGNQKKFTHSPIFETSNERMSTKACSVQDR